MSSRQRVRAHGRRVAGFLVVGLIAASCGDTDDSATTDTDNTVVDVDDDQTVETGEVATPEAPTDAPDDSQQAGAGLPPIDASCEPLPETDEATRSFDAAPPMCLEDGAAYSADVVTSAGTFTIDLDAQAAPTTVNSFVFLARNNYFDDTVCHRIIQEFVVQCGDPTATGTGGPGYSFPDELPEAGQYEVGSIAMANSGPDTNGSQFFIITGASGAALQPLYSLFGQVPADDLGVVGEMNARGSLDPSGVPSEEVRIESVEIYES